MSPCILSYTITSHHIIMLYDTLHCIAPYYIIFPYIICFDILFMQCYIIYHYVISCYIIKVFLVPKGGDLSATRYASQSCGTEVMWATNISRERLSYPVSDWHIPWATYISREWPTYPLATNTSRELLTEPVSDRHTPWVAYIRERLTHPVSD